MSIVVSPLAICWFHAQLIPYKLLHENICCESVYEVSSMFDVLHNSMLVLIYHSC